MLVGCLRVDLRRRLVCVRLVEACFSTSRRSGADAARSHRSGARRQKRHNNYSGPVAVIRDLVRERRGALCVNVVDAADIEGTMLGSTVLQTVLGNRPMLVAVNKSDRMPRLSDGDVKYVHAEYRSRIAGSKTRILGTHGVSTRSGRGVEALAQQKFVERRVAALDDDGVGAARHPHEHARGRREARPTQSPRLLGD